MPHRSPITPKKGGPATLGALSNLHPQIAVFPQETLLRHSSQRRTLAATHLLPIPAEYHTTAPLNPVTIPSIERRTRREGVPCRLSSRRRLSPAPPPARCPARPAPPTPPRDSSATPAAHPSTARSRPPPRARSHLQARFAAAPRPRKSPRSPRPAVRALDRAPSRTSAGLPSPPRSPPRRSPPGSAPRLPTGNTPTDALLPPVAYPLPLCTAPTPPPKIHHPRFPIS